MKREPAELEVLSKLLDDGLALPPLERVTWIECLPATYEGLKPTLRKLLLTMGPETGDVARFSQQVHAAVEGTLAEPANLQTGVSIGAYELIRELGRGGMGTVWLARRTEGLTNRQVALKLPHAGVFHARLKERIGRERDILESLTHPNIARLYDAGVTRTGQPFLALEYIEGTPLTLYCDKRTLGVRDRLTLFVQVLQAIQYAHSNLVIHRDLKPANILVTQQGTAVVLDFGIAKLLTEGAPAESAMTEFGNRALTPDYASPEQISGRPISTASDVYSLGVLLSELLCGSRPYTLKRDSRGALEDAIVEAEPSAPSRNLTPEAAELRAASASALSRELRGDLDNIVLKALRKDPLDRYASVALFAQDLDRYLKGEAVLAHPGSARYRAGKFLRRHTLAVASAATILVLLVLGVVGVMWQAHEARLEAARADQVKNFALSLIESADTANGAGVATTAVELLQKARQRVESELADRPAIAAELMEAIGSGLLGQGRPEDAEALLGKAAALSASVNGVEDIRTISTQILHAEALVALGKSDEAIALLEPAIESAHRLHANLVEADGWRWLSMAQIEKADFDAGIASAQAAVTAVGSAPAGAPELLSASLANLSLANALNSDRRPGVAEAARAALRFSSTPGAAVNTPHGSQARMLLGEGLIRDGEVPAGLRELEQAYADSKTLLGADHPQTVQVANLLGGGRIEAGDVHGAVAAYQLCYDSARSHPAALSPIAIAYVNLTLANALVATRDRERALPHYVEAERLFAEVDGPTAPMPLGVRSSRALALARLGRLQEADEVFASLKDMTFAGTSKAMYESRLAVLRSLQGRHAEAVALAVPATEGLSKMSSITLRAQSLSRLGSVLLAAGQKAQAVPPLEQAMALYGTQLHESPDRIETAADLRVASL
ncbi:MAG TPA: protein kinase [Steroidobacteraceae bacterium]|nr:protein kinase [Steroidobacteraceae bacterium]